MARISPLVLAVLLSLFALLFSLPFSSSLLTSSLTPIDVHRIVADLHSLLPLDDAASIHAYVQSLTLLDAPIPADAKASLTSTLTPLLSSRDLSDVHHSVAALALLGVKPSLPAPQLSALSTALSGPNLLPLYHAASTLLLLHRHSPPLPLSNYDFAKALSTLSSLEELDHTYRPSPKAEDGSIHNAALVYDLLARLADADPASYTAAARTALGFSDDALATDHAYGLPSDVTQAQAVGALTAAIGRLSAAVKAPPPLTPQQVETTAAYLLGNKLVVSVEEVAAVLDGLYAIAAFPPPLSPVAATLTDGGVGDSLTPHLTNVVGKLVKASAKTSITSSDGASVASWGAAALGAYSVTFAVDGSEVTYALKKTTAVKGLSATVAVTDGSKEGGGGDAGTTATYPAPMPHPFKADGGGLCAGACECGQGGEPVAGGDTTQAHVVGDVGGRQRLPLHRLPCQEGGRRVVCHAPQRGVVGLLGGGGGWGVVHIACAGGRCAAGGECGLGGGGPGASTAPSGTVVAVRGVDHAYRAHIPAHGAEDVVRAAAAVHCGADGDVRGAGVAGAADGVDRVP